VRSLALILLLGAAASSGEAAAQYQPEPRLFRLSDFGGYLELGVRGEHEKRERPNAATSFKQTESEFEELLHLDLGGSLYHPRFLRYQAGLELDLFQEVNHGNDRFLVAGDWRLNFLEQHPYGFSTFGSVSESQVDRRFARTYELRRQLYGTSFRYREGMLPFQIDYTHTSRTGTSDAAGIDEIADDASIRARYQMAGDSQGELEYHFTAEQIEDRDISRHAFIASNNSYLDDEKRRRLTSNLRYNRRSDFSEVDTLSGFGNFAWKHSDTLSTGYVLGLHRNEIDSQYVNNINMDVSLHHQLYRSLETNFHVYSRYENASFGNIETQGGSLSERYTKRLGDWGSLNISVTPSLELVRQRPKGGAASLADEPHQLFDGVPVQLRQKRIDPNTIVVTGSNCLPGPECVENVDYTVTQRDDVTELELIITGDIADGDAVLVDYEYQLSGRSNLLSAGVGSQVSVIFLRTLTLYGDFSSRDQDRIAGESTAQLDSRDRLVGGVKLRWSGITATAEYENDDSTFRDFWAVSQRLTLTSPPAWSWQASLSGSNRHQKYTDTDEKLSRMGLSTNITGRVLTRGLMKIEGGYQRERWQGGPSSGVNDVDAYGMTATFTWSFRSIRVSLEGRISRIDRAGHTEDNDRILLELRRSF
jgi:hypothetical protein